MNDILLPHRNSGSEILGSQTKEFIMKVFLISSLTFIFCDSLYCVTAPGRARERGKPSDVNIKNMYEDEA